MREKRTQSAVSFIRKDGLLFGRTWLELSPEPISAISVLQSCGPMSTTISFVSCSQLMTRHDMTDPGVQERKSEEIRREHMRLAKDSFFCQYFRERGR